MRKWNILIIGGLLLALTGCGAESEKEVGFSKEPIPVAESEQGAVDNAVTGEGAETGESSGIGESAETGESAGGVSESASGRKDGERFESVIMLEGMEETVKYEHAINNEIGIEIDFDYESLARKSESDKESFVSIYDDSSNPDNYLELAYRAEGSDSVIASISEELSKEYEISQGTLELANAGACTVIDTMGASSGGKMPGKLMTVYISPSGDGSLVGTAHYTMESAEGFGHLFADMMNTLVVTGKN